MACHHTAWGLLKGRKGLLLYCGETIAAAAISIPCWTHSCLFPPSSDPTSPHPEKHWLLASAAGVQTGLSLSVETQCWLALDQCQLPILLRCCKCVLWHVHNTFSWQFTLTTGDWALRIGFSNSSLCHENLASEAFSAMEKTLWEKLHLLHSPVLALLNIYIVSFCLLTILFNIHRSQPCCTQQYRRKTNKNVAAPLPAPSHRWLLMVHRMMQTGNPSNLCNV